jgi:hypothetical protein
MEQHKYAQAKPILEDVIANGKTAKGEKYGLNDVYQANFNAATDNSKESVWAYQASVNDGSGTNGNYGDNLGFPNGSGPGGCCGFNNPSINLANAYKTDGSGLPLLDTYNSGNMVSAETSPYTGNIDPRVDVVMGRPGIPYYDWGLVPRMPGYVAQLIMHGLVLRKWFILKVGLVQFLQPKQVSGVLHRCLLLTLT